MIVTLRRKAYFNASVRAEDGRIFGHDYGIEAHVAGPVDERTGMVVNITQIDRILKRHITGDLDGRLLNREVAYFERIHPTAETIADFAFGELDSKIGGLAELTEVTVIESAWTKATCKRDASQRSRPMITLTRAYDFSASHRLHSRFLSDLENIETFGKCNNPRGHGHNYEVEVTLAGVPDGSTGMLYSADALDRIVAENVLLPLDHKHLNDDVADFRDINPTSEMLAVVIWRRLASHLPSKAEAGTVWLEKVLVRETARNAFEYYGE
jgi:6-pyruvoyltetrahydropterin/6-carboxytetrahydropterin synthase